jgi:hypothetical protein
MLALANIALGIVISATPVAAQTQQEQRQDTARPAAQLDKEQRKDDRRADKNAPAGKPAPESLRPPIGPRTTQGLAEDAITRSTSNP